MALLVRAAAVIRLPWHRPHQPHLRRLLLLFPHHVTIHSSNESRFPTPRLSIFAIPSTPRRRLHSRPRGLRFPDRVTDSESKETKKESESRRNRNEKKREARRSVQWAMDLASFRVPQIRRILMAASLDEDVFEALMLVKRLGKDVREGKRRQFNLIGKLLRGVNPELLGALIQATKDGDMKTLQELSSSKELVDEEEQEEDYPSESEEEDEEDCHWSGTLASKWYDGLVNKDITISNEVYSLEDVDFDRQALRKLVRKVHLLQDHLDNVTENLETENARLVAAKRSLARYLHSLAKQISVEQNSFV